jgi:hypothetical protein
MTQIPPKFAWDVLNKHIKGVEQSYNEFFRVLGFLPIMDYLLCADQPLIALDARCNPTTAPTLNVLVWVKDNRARTPVYALEILAIFDRVTPHTPELRNWLINDAGVAPVVLLQAKIYGASNRTAQGAYYAAQPEILYALPHYDGYGFPLKHLTPDDASLIHPSLLHALTDACQTLITINTKRTQAVMQYLERDLRGNKDWLDGLTIETILTKGVQP